MQVLNVPKINKYLSYIKKGREDGLTKLFEYTSSNLHCVASMYLINKNDAEDVLSLAYEKAVKYIDSFDGRKNGYNWLFTIVKNCAKEFNERERRKRKIVCELDENLEDEFDELERVILKEALNKLDNDEKKLLYKIYWEGWEVKEIAKELDTPKSTIYSRLDSIYKKIKGFYKKDS
ncbi:MAG: RNA polymerase sigma factor [Clostridia bacterium]|nr:RNA polymerase sigma factor [Clostridia bacterium]